MTRHLLILGCGFSGLEVAKGFDGKVSGTARGSDAAARLERAGIHPVPFDGTAPSPALEAALATATHLLASIPPGEAGDPALLHHGTAIATAPKLQWIGYLSTVGVYGDHGGAWVTEMTPPSPVSGRGRMRVAAETAWRAVAARRGVPCQVFRLAGIYGPGRNTFLNLAKGQARRLVKPGQVFNRIHVADVAGLVLAGMAHLQAGPVFNGADDEPCPPQDVVAHAAALMGIEAPPEMPFEPERLSPMGRSFYGENKRVSNTATKAMLDYTFRYPTYREGLAALVATRDWENTER